MSVCIVVFDSDINENFKSLGHVIMNSRNGGGVCV